MTAQMTSSARRDRHPDFEHVAVYHEGDDDLAEQLVPDIAHALADGDAVLVCSPPSVWHRISARLGRASGDIAYVPDAVRYAHPNVAMRILNDFVRDRTRNGARAAWSIGAIPFNGDGVRNAEWVRYEQAVNEVLQHLPLRAICTYDVRATPPELLAEARCVHSNLDGATASARDADGHHAASPIALPSDEPLLQLQVHSSRSARHTVAEAYRELIDDDALGDLTLIVSEIVSNALDHGAPPVMLSACLLYTSPSPRD